MNDLERSFTDGVVTHPVTRRRFLHAAGAVGALAGLQRLAPAYALPASDRGAGRAALAGVSGRDTRVDLIIDRTPFGFGGRRSVATTINGSVPGPLLRFREGERATIHVTNRLREDTSIHWHGLLVPNAMDGVPGVNFPGIHPGQTFVYDFPLRQYGTYWYHSHSGFQEQLGHYGPLIIDPSEPEPFQYDREYVVMLSDWSFEDPGKILDNLKKQSAYYNFQRRTVGDFFRDVDRNGLRATIADRWEWGKMRMTPTDISDVTGSTYTYLLNGLPPAANWTGLFRAGERVRLRFINAGAGSYFDVRIPGLEMTLVQASGQHVQPVAFDEFRIEIAQTFDVIVKPTEDRAYTIFAESMDRSGYARGTLAPRAGMSAEIPRRRPRPTLNMVDMGMAMGMGGHEGMSMPGMDMSGTGTASKPGADASMPGMDMPAAATKPAAAAASGHAGHDMSSMPGVTASGGAGVFEGQLRDGTIIRASNLRAPGTIPEPVMHGNNTHGSASAGTAMETRSRLSEPGAGLGEDGWRVLVWTDVKRLTPAETFEPPVREIELHLTGNMERYSWSFDGKKYSEAPSAIRFRYGERLRLVFVNDTMMEHPIHLHGMWMELENGGGPNQPRLHTVLVKPGERLTVAITADEPGRWAMHCHLLLHMEMGMFRVVEVA